MKLRKKKKKRVKRKGKETIVKPAEKAFVENYINPESDTYNNGTNDSGDKIYPIDV